MLRCWDSLAMNLFWRHGPPGQLLGAYFGHAFGAVLSTEVVERVYSPLQWATAPYASLNPGGVVICSTPYND